jgi:hypothetical protein
MTNTIHINGGRMQGSSQVVIEAQVQGGRLFENTPRSAPGSIGGTAPSDFCPPAAARHDSKIHMSLYRHHAYHLGGVWINQDIKTAASNDDIWLMPFPKFHSDYS